MLLGMTGNAAEVLSFAGLGEPLVGA